MSVSPQISDPKTPDNAKRPRSPTPPLVDFVPLAPGVQERGFRQRAELIRYPQVGMPEDSETQLREDMAYHTIEVLAGKIADANFNETVQAINTLFELAASLSVMDPRLDALHHHVIQALDIIGGAEAPDWRE
jgi:hypothetical protein